MFSKHGVLMGATVALAMALSGCRLLDDFSPSPSESSSTASTMDASQWTFEYSPGMPGHPSTADNGWTFAFPTANGVHYLTTKQHPGSASAAISASISVETSGDPFFEYRTEPGNTCEAPATVRLYFQRRGDNMSGDGDYEFYRWWNNSAAFVLGPGRMDLVGDLTDPSQWTSVFGKHGDVNEPMFRAALADIGEVGFTFGGGCFYGHGVYIAPATGQAIFKTTDYVVR